MGPQRGFGKNHHRYYNKTDMQTNGVELQIPETNWCFYRQLSLKKVPKHKVRKQTNKQKTWRKENFFNELGGETRYPYAED